MRNTIYNILNTVDFKQQSNGYKPYSINSLSRLTKISKVTLLDYIQNSKDIEFKIKEGTYPSFKMINDQTQYFYEFYKCEKLSFLEKEVLEDLTKYYNEGDDELTFLEYKRKYNITTTPVDNNRYSRIFKKYPFENLFIKTDIRLPYNLGENVVYDTDGYFKYKVRSNTSYVNKTLNKRLSAIRSNAKQRGLIMEITTEDLLNIFDAQNGLCYYSKQELTIDIQTKENTKFSMSVDRLDPNKGYIKDNIVLCLNVYNMMKSTLSEDDFKKYILLAANTFKEDPGV